MENDILLGSRYDLRTEDKIINRIKRSDIDLEKGGKIECQPENRRDPLASCILNFPSNLSDTSSAACGA